MQFFLSFMLVISFATFQHAFGDIDKVDILADDSKQDEEVAKFETLEEDDEQDDDADYRWLAPEMFDEIQRRSNVSKLSAGGEGGELTKNKKGKNKKKNKNKDKKKNKPPKKKFKNTEMKLWIDNVGCYKDKGVRAWRDPRIRAITYLYLNIRRRRGRRINWQWGDFVEVIMECAHEAQIRGYACFGIEFYGECWGSVEACDTYARYGNSSKCIQGVGLHWALFVYKAKCGSVYGCCPGGAMPARGPNYKGCPDCVTAVDVVFVVDSSGSIGEGNFAIVKEVIQNLIGHFSVSAVHARIGIVQYATNARIIYSLRQSQRFGFRRLEKRVKNLFYTKGGTKTGKGLSLAHKMLRRSKRRLHGKFLKHKQVTIVLTDGITNNDNIGQFNVFTVALKGISRVVAMGVSGNGYTTAQQQQQHAELNRIASSPKDCFFEMSFEALKKIVGPIARRACPIR